MIPKALGQAGPRNYGTGSLRYPNQMITNETDYVEIKLYEYKPPFQGGTGGRVSGYNKSASVLGTPIGSTIQLYMPEDVGVQYQSDWSTQNFSAIGKAGIIAAGKTIEGDINDAAGTLINQMKKSIANMGQGTGTAKAASEALKAINFGNYSVNDILGTTTGQILNPNTEVLYNGPKLRGFSLSFKMSPDSETEANNIAGIIRLLKYAMLPEYGTAGAGGIVSFVKVPAIVDVTFKKGNVANPNVTQFKPCAVMDLDISYTPDGAYSTFTDGKPVATSLKITFQELKMVYAEEIDQGY